MAKAKRHYIPGYICHITHRCHKREFLLGFSKDRHRYLRWLYQARKRYGLMIWKSMSAPVLSMGRYGGRAVKLAHKPKVVHRSILNNERN